MVVIENRRGRTKGECMCVVYLLRPRSNHYHLRHLSTDLGRNHEQVTKLEFLIAFLVLTIAVCFIDCFRSAIWVVCPSAQRQWFYWPCNLIPWCYGYAAARHNLFLHSVLVLSRKIPRSVSGIKVMILFLLKVLFTFHRKECLLTLLNYIFEYFNWLLVELIFVYNRYLSLVVVMF